MRARHARTYGHTRQSRVWQKFSSSTVPSIEAELLRRNQNGEWPSEPFPIGAGGNVELQSLGFTSPLVAFYRGSSLYVEAR